MIDLSFLYEEQEPFKFGPVERTEIRRILQSIKGSKDAFVAATEAAVTMYLGQKVPRDRKRTPSPSEVRRKLISIATHADKLARDLNSLDPIVELHSLARALAFCDREANDADAYAFIAAMIDHMKRLSTSATWYANLKPGDYSAALGEDNQKIQKIVAHAIADESPATLTAKQFWCLAIELEVMRMVAAPGARPKYLEVNLIRQLGRIYEDHLGKKPSRARDGMFGNLIVLVMKCLKSRGCKNLPRDPRRLVKRALSTPPTIT